MKFLQGNRKPNVTKTSKYRNKRTHVVEKKKSYTDETLKREILTERHSNNTIRNYIKNTNIINLKQLEEPIHTKNKFSCVFF